MGDADGFIGSIPQHYDESLGPLIFVDYGKPTSRIVWPLVIRRGYWRQRPVPGSSRAGCAISCLLAYA